MAYKFKRKESTTKALQRLCAERIGEALGQIKECHALDAVHGVRKEIKKLRALLRLVESGMRPADFRGVIRDLKQAARHFGPARDAHVTSQALGLVLEHYHQQMGPRQFADVRPVLREACREQEKCLHEQRLPRRVVRIFGAVQKEVNSVKLRREGWAVVGTGIKRSYAAGRRAWKLALAKPRPENLHEWRKQVKQLGYQLGLLSPIWPEQLQAAENELKKLGQYLGDDHDLFMLKQAIQKRCASNARPGELELLSGLIAHRQNELRTAAMALGARFYSEKPSAFCQRLGGYWKIWCRRSARVAGKKCKVGKLAK